MSNEPRDDAGFIDEGGQDARLNYDNVIRNRMARMIPTDGAVTPSLIADTRSAFAEYLKEHGISQGQAAKGLGQSESYVSSFIGNPDAIPATTLHRMTREVNTWMELDFHARQVKRPKNFVNTKVAELAMRTAKNVKAARMIGLFEGPAGMGKTCCFEAVAAEIPGTILLTVDYDSRSASGFLRLLTDRVRLRRRKRERASLRYVVENLRGSGRLLLIDQAQDLRDSAFPLLMSLHDQAELPIVLIGTRDIHERCRDDQDVSYGQFSSRIGYRVDLLVDLKSGRDGGQRAQWISVGEIRRIFEHTVKFHPDAARMLAEVANEQVGSLRRVRHLVRVAEAIAARDSAAGGVIQAAHIERAMRRVAGGAAMVRPQAGERPAAAATA